ncbi:MAG: hypothetical protein INR62_00385 [Rhodospirillales bacterium]|nr:hypothetical protein [Acetobacter sp.]
MRLKRKMTEAEFASAIQYMRPPPARVLEIAHADLVRGIKQADIAKEYQITKGSVSQASKRVYLGFLRSKGFKEIGGMLPDARAFIVESWIKEAENEINRNL